MSQLYRWIACARDFVTKSTPSRSWMFNCHCRDCQKTTGGSYAPGHMPSRPALSRLRKERRTYYKTASEMAGDVTCAAFARNVVRDSSVGLSDIGQGIAASTSDGSGAPHHPRAPENSSRRTPQPWDCYGPQQAEVLREIRSSQSS